MSIVGVLGLVIVAGIPLPCNGQPVAGPSDLAKIAQWKDAKPNAADAFHFVIMGDNTGGHMPDEWQAAIKQVNLLKPDFVMCVGELAEGHCKDAKAAEALWDEFDAMMKDVEPPSSAAPEVTM
jgi:hypothetical protein